MHIIKTEFPGLIVFDPKILPHDRVYFFESNKQNLDSSEGIEIEYVNDNQSNSTFGLIRVLQFQAEPYSVTKLICALSGSILDIVVNIRTRSTTYGKVYSIELSAENKKRLLV